MADVIDRDTTSAYKRIGARSSQSTPKNAPVDSGIDLIPRNMSNPAERITVFLVSDGSFLRFLIVLSINTQPNVIPARKTVAPRIPV